MKTSDDYSHGIGCAGNNNSSADLSGLPARLQWCSHQNAAGMTDSVQALGEVDDTLRGVEPPRAAGLAKAPPWKFGDDHYGVESPVPPVLPATVAIAGLAQMEVVHSMAAA